MSKPIAKYGVLVTACVMWFTVGYGRVIVGVHSWCQVCLGYILGVWTILVLHFLIRKHYYRHIEDLLYCRAKNFKKYLGFALGLHIVLCATAFITFFILDNYYVEIKDEWVENLIYHGCEDKLKNLSFQTKSLSDLMMVNASFGIYYGILL
jgi:hypothetical protein